MMCKTKNMCPKRTESKLQRVSRRASPPCSSPLFSYELACRMLNAIGWDGTDFRLRDPVALAIAPEVERINKQVDNLHKHLALAKEK